MRALLSAWRSDRVAGGGGVSRWGPARGRAGAGGGLGSPTRRCERPVVAGHLADGDSDGRRRGGVAGCGGGELLAAGERGEQHVERGRKVRVGGERRDP